MGNSLTFLSVSSGVAGAAGSLVSSAASSQEAVAGMSGSSANRVVSLFGDVTGLLSGMGVHMVSVVLGLVAPSPKIPGLSVVPPKTAPSVKVVKGLMAHLKS